MLKNFNFCIPTKIVFGPQKEGEVGSLIAGYLASKVLVVIGKNSVIKSGLLNRVLKSLEKENITYSVLQGVRANPTFDLVIEGKKIVLENGIDFILAIGGGSVIDTAKCIAVNACYDGDIHDFNYHLAIPNKALPIGVILTISAAGSEMSNSCVIQDDATNKKMGFNSELIRPVFAIENPELTFGVSKEQTAYGIVDILMHTLERYFCDSDEHELADEFALGVIKNVIEVGHIAYNEPDNYDARARIMLASSLSHCGLTHIGKPFMMPVHQLEHAVSGMFPNIAHGLGLAILFPGWCEEYLPYEKEKMARLSRHVFGNSGNDDETAQKMIRCFKDYFKKMNLPSSLEEVGIKEKDIDTLVDIVSQKGNRVISHRSHPMDAKVMKDIFYRVLK